MKENKLVYVVKCFVVMFVVYALGVLPAYAQLRNDIKWVTSSVEYAALCTQTYRSAWQAVQQAAQTQTNNWVVVLDVDETVLDNSQYAVERTKIDSGFTPQSWAEWVFRKEAMLVPGAKEFIDGVRSLGPNAHIAYITNRNFEHEQATIENLQKYGLFKPGDTMLTRKNRQDKKSDRRRCLEAGTGRCKKNGPLVIVALLGDNIRDFMEVVGAEKAKKYRTKELPGDERWGTKFFMLPNPTYGSWERDYR
ncbi:MAG: HAD family acid phosphatase [bacterium]